MKTKMDRMAAIVPRLLAILACICAIVMGVWFLAHSQTLGPQPGQTTNDVAQLEQIYAAVRSAVKSIPPGSNAPALRRAMDNELDNELETFLTNYPSSPLVPRVRLELARKAQLRSCYLAAMDHYSRAWEELKYSTNRIEKRFAAAACSGLAKLLALTGRLPELAALETEVKELCPQAMAGSEWNWAMEMHAWANRHPKDSYKCGLYCLDQLGRLTQYRQFLPRNITETESSTNGFTAADLCQVATRVGLRVHAATLNDFSKLPVPCIVHLSCEHFVVVREKRGDFYDVYDPVAFGPRWLLIQEFAKEASGCVIVSDATAPSSNSSSLRTIDSISAAAYRGRCHGPLPNDHDDTPCTDCSCPPGTGNNSSGQSDGGRMTSGQLAGGQLAGGQLAGGQLAGGQLAGGQLAGGSCSGCASAKSGGMPTWFVSEPYLSLWVQDTPLEYHPSYGPDVSLHLAYQNHNTPSVVSGVWWRGATFGNSTGRNIWDDLSDPNWSNGQWACSWLSFAEMDDTENTVDVALPGGGRATFVFLTSSTVSDVNYRHNSWVEKVTSAGVTAGLVLHQADGSKLTYGINDSTTASNEGLGGLFFLTAQSDPAGDNITFSYDSNFLLTTVTAADGTAFTLHYDDSYLPSYVTSVTSSYGSSSSFSYQSFGEMLDQITDAAGIVSQIGYGWLYGGPIGSLRTPYGTTTFITDNAQTGGFFDRNVWITRPDYTMELYAQLNDYTPWGNDWPDFSSDQIPTNTPVGTLDADSGSRQERNTFYWNAQQIANIGGSFDWNTFKYARIRHWLASTDPVYTHYSTLSLEQAPSPDGTTEGQITWYDYLGKPSGRKDERGTQIYPSVIARVMPDSSTWCETIQYNSIGKATNIVEAWNNGATCLKRTNDYVYAANGVDMLMWTNALRVLASSNYFNAYHQVTKNYDALGQMTAYTYDSTTLQMSSVSRPTGLVTTNIYDATSRRLLKTIDLQINRTNAYTWASSGDMQTHTDERNMTVTYFWDALHHLTGVGYPDGTATTNLYTVGEAYPYSSGGLDILDLTATRDRLGLWTYFEYDSLRRKIGETNANGVVTRYGFCDCGGVAYVTNAYGADEQFVTYFDFDYQGHRIVTHYPDATLTNWFDSLGRLITTGDNWGYRWFSYDNLSRMTNVSNAYGAEQGTVFDILDRPIYVTDANGVMITNTYDVLNRLWTRGYPDGGVERFGYSARGLVAYTNQLNFTNFYAYDEAMRKTFETNANGEVIRYTNNAASDLLSLTDGKNQTTRWKYDSFGRVTNKLDQAGMVILKYAYDPDNRLTNRWSNAKGTTTYKYDNVGNLTNIVYPSGTTSVKLRYDPLNRVTNMVDAVGTTVYRYAAGGQLFTEDGPWASDTVTNVYTYRLRTDLGLQQPTGFWTNQFGYDSAKRLASVTSPAGEFDYEYRDSLPSTLVQKLTQPTGAYITNVYDGNARLLGTWLKTSGNLNRDVATYSYNVGNQRTSAGLTNAASGLVNYSYDKIGQLKVADSSNNGEDRGYSYDAAWNLNWRTNSGQFSVDNKNQITSASTVFVLEANYGYDSNGNLNNFYYIDGGDDFEYNYMYDAENRLVVAEGYQLGVTTIYGLYRSTFAYDGLSRLRQRVDYSWDSGLEDWVAASTINYIYDGMRVIQERDDANTPTVSYTRGSDLSGTMEGAGGIGGMLARSHGYSGGNWSTHNFYHADGNGNITCLINASQASVASYRYDAFGNTLSSSGTLAAANKYRFSSKEIYEGYYGVTLYYYGYRFYDPNLQRWLNRDPVTELGFLRLHRLAHRTIHLSILDSSYLLNEYSFNFNNPPKYIDPDGEMALWIVIPVTIVLIICLTAPKLCHPSPAPPPPPPSRRPPPQTCPISTPGDGAGPDDPPWYPGDPNDPRNYPPQLPEDPADWWKRGEEPPEFEAP